ncbi:MAG: hypothetical protein ACR2PG_15020 [Hyphomicrobiaceae bacterium]
MAFDKSIILQASLSSTLYLVMAFSLSAQGISSVVSRYDLGYAHKAAQDCPQLALLVDVDNDDLVSPDFVRGATIVTQQIKQIGLELICKFATNLYDAQSGKVAKLLRKSP